jgi:hypothetical protein
MQYYGILRDETGANEISESMALDKIQVLLKQLKTEYHEAKDYLSALYAE